MRGLNVLQRQSGAGIKHILDRPTAARKFQNMGYRDSRALDHGLATHDRWFLLDVVAPMHCKITS